MHDTNDYIKSVDGVTTKEVVEQYLGNAKTAITEIKRYVDCEDVYSYERKVNKNVFDMSYEELLDMFKEIYDKYRMFYNTFIKIIMAWKNVITFYSANIAFKKNPFLSGFNLEKAFEGFNNEKRISLDEFESIIENVNIRCDKGHAVFIELFMRLFFCGARTAKEIIMIEKKNIDFDNKSIRLEDRTIKITDRIVNLLHENQSINKYRFSRNIENYFLPWKDRYIKIPVRTLNEKDPGRWASAALRCIRYNMGKIGCPNIVPLDIAYLGFYTYLIEKYSYEKMRDYLTSERSNKRKGTFDSVLRDEAVEYGLYGKENVPKAPVLRSRLVSYI